MPTWTLTANIELVSESNRSGGHWSTQHKRTKAQHRQMLAALMLAKVPRSFLRVAVDMGLRPEILIVRQSAGTLDSDNLVTSGKRARDFISRWGELDDKDPRVTWNYAQEKATTFGVRVEITLHPKG